MPKPCKFRGNHSKEGRAAERAELLFEKGRVDESAIFRGWVVMVIARAQFSKRLPQYFVKGGVSLLSPFGVLAQD
jgi:hypothetical protein